MKLAAFSALRAVLRHGTFAAAAGELNITPSAVSMQMKQLEGYFGQPLFDRSGPHPRPTAFATRIAELVGDTLDGLDALRQGSPMVIEGTVRLGIIEHLQPALLPGVVRWLREHHPKVDLDLVRGRSTALISAVKSGEADAAVVAQPGNGGSATLKWHPVFTHELVLLAPPDSPVVPPEALFDRYEWIRYDRNSVSGTLAAQTVQRLVGDVRGRIELGSPAAIVAMVSAGLGISVLFPPDLSVLSYFPVRILPLGEPAPTLQISLVMRKLDEDNRRLQATMEAVAAACKQRRAVVTAAGFQRP